MLVYPLTADVPEVVVYRLITVIRWPFTIGTLRKLILIQLFDRKWAGVLSRDSFPRI